MPPLRMALCLLTLNATRTLPALLDSLALQTRQPDYWLVIDSESEDDTVAQCQMAGACVKRYPRADFDHAGTRQWALNQLTHYEIVVFITQDILFAHPDSLAQLCAAFTNPAVHAAYGRQYPHIQATAIAAHARLFNYPATSRHIRLVDKSHLGIKAAFCSDSFAAYRIAALQAVGGFPLRNIVGEDACAVGKLLLAGGEVAYCAEAGVYHSHNFTVWQELQRYFDIGVFHQEQAWLLATFGRAEGEGWRFLRSEWRYLAQHAPWQWPNAVLRTLAKYAGYRLGRHYNHWPRSLCRWLSQSRHYWR